MQQSQKYTKREHIPPKSILIEPEKYKDVLITVPSCEECNSGTSLNDLFFQIYMALYLGWNTPLRKQLHKRAKKSLSKNNVLKNKILAQDVSKLLVPSHIGYAHPVKINKKILDLSIEKITRGLFHHITSGTQYIPSDATIDIHIVKQGHSFVKSVVDIVKSDVKIISRCGNQFIAYHGIVPNRSDASIWFYRFYGEDCFLVFVTPKNHRKVTKTDFIKSAGNTPGISEI